jgi:hypothetical protein
MSNQKFEEFLNRQTENAKSKPIDWDKERDDWIGYLELFYSSIQSFLKPYLEGRKIKIAYGEKKIFEEDIGEYEARNAIIFFGSNKVKLEPIGTNLIGVKGRVDLIGPNGKVKFVLVNSTANAPKIPARVGINEPPLPEEKCPDMKSWAWKIATSPPNIRYFEFEPDSFFDALMEVANG